MWFCNNLQNVSPSRRQDFLPTMPPPLPHAGVIAMIFIRMRPLVASLWSSDGGRAFGNHVRHKRHRVSNFINTCPCLRYLHPYCRGSPWTPRPPAWTTGHPSFLLSPRPHRPTPAPSTAPAVARTLMTMSVSYAPASCLTNLPVQPCFPENVRVSRSSFGFTRGQTSFLSKRASASRALLSRTRSLLFLQAKVSRWDFQRRLLCL